MADRLSVISASLITIGSIGLFIYFMAILASGGDILEEKYFSKILIETIKKIKNIVVVCLIFGLFFFYFANKKYTFINGGSISWKKSS